MGLNKAKGRMFKSVGWTWNPLGGCSHDCKYCYAAQLMKRWGKDFTPNFRSNFLEDKMPEDHSWIFVGSMGDTFCEGMKTEWIEQLFTFIERYSGNNKFLLQTKNPRRFENYELEKIKHKVILGTTLETTGNTSTFSSAPSPIERFTYLRMMKRNGFKTFLSLEPLADFGFNTMVRWIAAIEPEAVEIGLENYTKYTTPPPEKKIRSLLDWLDDNGFPYILKENLKHLYTRPDGDYPDEE